MENLSLPDKKEKIIQLIKMRGPSLPVHISKEIQETSLLSSAFLADLVSEQRIKISSIKVGGSPLYFLPGQEPQLEKFHTSLPLKEKQAFLLLKQKKILRDSKQQPAIRVALRQLRDFAKPFKAGDEIFWRFYNISEQEALEKISRKIKIKEKPVISHKKPAEAPLLDIGIKSKTKKPKLKEKSEFVTNIIELLKRQGIELAEELEAKKRDYLAKIKVNSQIGRIDFLCVAKDKKRISDSDLGTAHSKGQKSKLPVLFITPGELTKKAQEYLEKDLKGYLVFKRLRGG